MKHPPQEHDAVQGRGIVAVAIAVIVATVAGVLVAYGLGRWSAEDWPVTSILPLPPEVSAMETGLFDLEAQGLEMNQRATQHLDSYGWVQEEAGLVRVPIDVAIELVLKREPARGARP
jgi:hypothetical protein